MPVTTQQVLTELATTSMPSANIANSFNIAGYESNIFLKDWCMLINGLYLINREHYKDAELDWFEPRPSPYSFSSPSHNITRYGVRIDLEMDDFDSVTNYQRDRGQPFNGITAEPLDMNTYATLFGSTFDNCPWLLIHFATVSPMQFVLDTAKTLQKMKLEDEEDISIKLSNKTTAMLANINVELTVGTPQVPQYDDILVA